MAGETIGINLFGRQPVDAALRALPALPALGYGAVDYSAAAGRLAEHAEALTSLEQLTRELGLVPAGTHYRSFGVSFLASQEERAVFARNSVVDVRAAAFLGARAVAFHVRNKLSPEGTATDEALAAANAEAFRPAVAAAESEGVIVALENHCHGSRRRHPGPGRQRRTIACRPHRRLPWHAGA